MISFIWPLGESMLAGTGGSETYTAGQIRELRHRGIDAQVVTIGVGVKDGRDEFKGVPFLALQTADEINSLPGTIVFVNNSFGAYKYTAKNKSFVIFHNSIPMPEEREKYQDFIVGKTIMTTSVYSGQKWALYLGIPYSKINVVLPFADPIFGNVKRSKPGKKIRILFAGRLHPDKGIYTILEMMHKKDMQNDEYQVTLVSAGIHVEIGREIARMLKNYPYAKLIPAQKNVKDMAKLLAKSDILLMPSVFAEPFGMLSVEAQHAGCRVVASNVGGLPETNSGLLTLVEIRDPNALMSGIKQAVALGLSTPKERIKAVEYFTLPQSVDALLEVITRKSQKRLLGSRKTS